jgi:hypothetical protein
MSAIAFDSCDIVITLSYHILLLHYLQSPELTGVGGSGTMVSGEYMSAKSIDDAKIYAVDELGLRVTDYEDMNLDVANVVNKEIKAVYDAFGNVNSGGCIYGLRVGALKTRVSIKKRRGA